MTKLLGVFCLHIAIAIIYIDQTESAWIFRKGKQPLNIIFMMSDDQGWGDVEWSEHPQRPPTPNLRKLKEEGVELLNYYSQPKCTAARGALMTGRYPYKTGIATNDVFGRNINTTLDLRLKLMPAFMQDLGYRTHGIGKWHLGFCAKNATPTARGFDTFYGTYDNVKSFYHHGNSQGYDWTFDVRENDTYTPQFDADGTYNTYLMTDRTKEIIREHATTRTDEPFFIYSAYLPPHKPVQAPEEYTSLPGCARITRDERRIQCGMVAAIDDSVGQIMNTLRQYNMMRNTVIIYTSDNGAAEGAANSAWPLRGSKQTVYEGGVKVRTLIRSPVWLKDMANTTYDYLMHVTDWLPTLYVLGGGDWDVFKNDPASDSIDGRNVFTVLRKNKPTKRVWLPLNIDSERELAAVRYENVSASQSFKLVRWEKTEGLTGFRFDLRENVPEGEELQKQYPQPDPDPEDGLKWRMYDLRKNPQELEPCGPSIKGPCTEEDAAQVNPAIYELMKKKLKAMEKDEVVKAPQVALPFKGPGRPRNNEVTYNGTVYKYYTYGDCECNNYYNVGEECPQDVFDKQKGIK